MCKIYDNISHTSEKGEMHPIEALKATKKWVSKKKASVKAT